VPVYSDLKAQAVGGWLGAERPGEIELICAAARRIGGPVLELASGAGRVMRCLAREHHDVIGVEASPAMLKMAHETTRNLATRDRMRFVRGDMRTFSFGRRFPLVIVPFNSFWYNLDERGAGQCLERIVAHTDPGGVFLVDSPFGYFAETLPPEGADAWWVRKSAELGFSFTIASYHPEHWSDQPCPPGGCYTEWQLLTGTLCAPST
jgi:hypothetical protein